MSLSDTDSDIFHDALEQEYVDIENNWSIQTQHNILHDSTNSDSFIPKEMPSSPPPPPPISPTKFHNPRKKTSKKTKKMKDFDNHPIIISDHDHVTNDKNQTTKKKKKSKTKKKQKNPKAKSNVYEKQYKSSTTTNNHISIPINYSNDGKDVTSNTSWFQFWGRKQNSYHQPIPYESDRIFAKFTRSGKPKINIGELNSALGEGTTVPQLLTRMRYITFFLAICTIIMESWAFLFHVILLETDKVVMGFYLMFFVGLLVCYEIVRGQPRPGSFVDGNWTDLVVFQEFDITELVWKTVLESKVARQIRYFLQENFGILYSCWGRGLYLLFVGGICFGQGILWMGKLVGGMFFMFGIWTISLKYHNPLFEKALIMDLDHEFKADATYPKYDRDRIVTWTSLRSRMNHNVGERQRLIKAVSKSNRW